MHKRLIIEENDEDMLKKDTLVKLDSVSDMLLSEGPDI